METLRILETDSTGDTLQAKVDYKGKIAIEIYEPWAGDSEIGFGRSGTIRLDSAQAKLLANWLLEVANK